VIAVGQRVDLLLAFGNQQRLKCPHCKKFMPVSEEVTCKGCGTAYVAKGKQYVVTSVPSQESVA
jgi:uncharacterized Zn-finger protein